MAHCASCLARNSSSHFPRCSRGKYTVFTGLCFRKERRKEILISIELKYSVADRSSWRMLKKIFATPRREADPRKILVFLNKTTSLSCSGVKMRWGGKGWRPTTPYPSRGKPQDKNSLKSIAHRNPYSSSINIYSRSKCRSFVILIFYFTSEHLKKIPLHHGNFITKWSLKIFKPS